MKCVWLRTNKMQPSDKNFRGPPRKYFLLISWIVGLVLCTVMVGFFKYYGIYEDVSWFRVMSIPLFAFIFFPGFVAVITLLFLRIERWLAARRQNRMIADSRVTELSKIAGKLLNFCIENHLSIKGKQTTEQLAIKAVYDIILELAAASQLMMNNRYCVNSAALLRSLFEYNVELHWLIENLDKIQKRYLDARLEQRKIANEIGNSTDDRFKEIKQDPIFSAQKKQLEDETKGHAKQSMQKLCKDLNDSRGYTSIYRLLSQDAHPNIIRYWNRYFPQHDDGSLKMLSPERTIEDFLAKTCLLSAEDWIGRVCLLSEVLIESTRKIHRFDSTLTEEIDKKLSEFKNEILKAL